MSGYRHSGMSREDYEAREKLYDTAVLIEERWPGQYSVLCRDLRDLGDTVSEEGSDEEPVILSPGRADLPPGTEGRFSDDFIEGINQPRH